MILMVTQNLIKSREVKCILEGEKVIGKFGLGSSFPEAHMKRNLNLK